MSRFDQQMREVERSLAQLGGKTQATKIRKSLEKKIQLAAAKKLPKIQTALVKSGRTGWVNDPGPKSGAVLVERDTGCVLLDFQGKEIRGSKVSVRSATPLDKAVFLQHLTASRPAPGCPTPTCSTTRPDRAHPRPRGLARRRRVRSGRSPRTAPSESAWTISPPGSVSL